MAVIALAGCSGAPGVTTSALALLLSWPLEPGRRMILAECDPDGSAVLHGLLQGTLGDRYGLRNLSVAARQGELGDAFFRQLIDLSSDEGKKESPRDRLLLPGITDPAQAASLGSVWKALGVIFRGIEAEHGHDVLIDLGRRGRSARPVSWPSRPTPCSWWCATPCAVCRQPRGGFARWKSGSVTSAC